MAAGFFWGANNPYLRTIWVKVRRAPKGLNPAFAMIGADANPAHIIYECMTNRDWGMGSSPGAFDIASFEAAGETLFNEAFGLSLVWMRSTTIELFVTEILDHIQGNIYVHPRTGLITLMLLRDDYDIESLPVINPSNATLTNLQRKAWGETSNEMVVTWTNPLTEKEETVTAHDLANIGQQGGIITSNKNYYAVRKKELAARLAERDLRASTQPLATADVEALRHLWDVLPGQVFALEWPEKGIERLIVRAGVVNYGKPGDSKIKFPVYEDVFGLGGAEYSTPPETEWEDPSEDPAPLSNVMLLTAPAFLTFPALELLDPSMIEYPEVITVILAQPDSPDDQDFELIGQVVQPNGAVVFTSFGTRDFIGGATLADAIPAEVETFIATWDAPTGASPLAGNIVVFGEGGDEDTEIALVKEVTEAGWTFTRGVLDTVPRAWPAGTRVWSLGAGKVVADTTLRSDGETVDYRLLTRTSRGLLDFEAAPTESVTLTGRPHLPNRPANVTAGGVDFGTLDATGLATIPVTWANRNRVLETSQILAWTEASVLPEDGQTTRITILSPDRTPVTTIDGLTGTSRDITMAELDGHIDGIIRVTAVRDGLESLQGHEINYTSAEAAPRVNLDFLAQSYQNDGATVSDLSTLPGWSYSRAGVAYARKLDGLLTSFAANVPRRTDKGLLIEAAATNVTTYARDFGNAAWSKLGAGTGVAPVVSGTLVAAPDGSTTARSVTLNRGATDAGGNLSVLLKNDAVTAGQTYTRSVWLRAATPGVYVFRRVGGGYQQCAVTTTWQRFSHTGVAAAASDGFQIGLVGGNGAVQSGTLEVWNAQTELGSTASSEIETTAAAVTRPADTASLTIPDGPGTDTITVVHTGGTTVFDRSTMASPTVIDLGGTSGKPFVGQYLETVERAG